MKNYALPLCLLLLAAFTQGCEKITPEQVPSQPADEQAFRQGTNNKKDFYTSEGDIVLGTQLKNPYQVHNMQLAYDDLTKSGNYPCSQIVVRPTHYYVRFNPQTFDQYNALVNDSTLDLSDFPLDYEIKQEGNSYHDPSLPGDAITYQYAAVKISYSFVDTIPYKILETLYIPEEDEMLLDKTGSNDANIDCIDKLLDQAYKQTGNYEDTLSPDDYTFRRPKYFPGGNIHIFDTRLNTNIGLQGVDVRARRWFTTYHARTDFNGNYRMSFRFRRPCNYSLWFATGWFSVRRNLINTTHWINGPKQDTDWNLTISNGYSRFAGHVFRGAYRYHYQDIGGLKRPRRLPVQINYRQVYVAVDAGLANSGINYMVVPVIRISRFANQEETREFDSDEVFSTTCHETAHTSHAMRMNTIIQYWQVTAQLQESWAIGIEWFLTRLEYTNRGVANYGDETYSPLNTLQFPNQYGYQFWNSGFAPVNTSLYINLMDNFNESGQVFPGILFNGTVDDDVTGYSPAFIEDNILKHAYGLTSLGNELKAHKPTGTTVTDAQIDQLLSFY